MSSKAGLPATAVANPTEAPPWREGIAVVGMSARFPKCPSLDRYWEQISAGNSLLSEPGEEELRRAGIDTSSFADSYFVRSGTHLEDAESFDAKFFDLTRREAEIMDPQQRVFLESAYEALEHAGMTGSGERVGVFAGIGMNTYLMQLLGNPEMLAAAGGYQLMLGNDKDFLATRVAYKLNLRGPAVVVQTACSTSLAAVHLACQSLLSHECDSAMAGGVSVMFPQVAGYSYIPGMILSPDGVCRPFDERANGTVPGKGAGIVVLKRESDARAAGDTIYAVIAGSAWNNDGSSKVGYTAPSVEGQVEVIRKAHAAAGVHPDRIGFVEAHGTGTELGDPVEVAALAEAFGDRPEGAPRCVLGSVKANMGHTDVAAGVAGLIKAVMAVHHGVIPPTPHFERPNPVIGMGQTPFRVSAQSEQWPAGDNERWAGVSSFGIGGTNVHVCLRRAGGVKADPAPSGQGPWIFPVSAKTQSALESSTHRLMDFLEATPDVPLATVAATLQTGRRAFPARRSVVAGSREELIAALRAPTKSKQINTRTEQIAFLFPGQGQQFPGMAGTLFQTDRVFRHWVDRGLALLPDDLSAELRSMICDNATADQRDFAAISTSRAQPLLFLVEYALAMRWMDLGIKPALLVGHSLGEVTAAAVAGVFSFEDGLRLAVLRGNLMEQTIPGAMLAVSLSAEGVAPYLTPELWMAAENSPKLTVISGSEEAIQDAERRLKGARIGTVRLRTDRAFHTPHMAEASTLFRAEVAGVERKVPELPFLSNVLGHRIGRDEATSPQYWADQITSRVRFAENAAVLIKEGYFLLEVGPGDALSTLVRQQDRSCAFASTLGTDNRRGDDLRAFLDAAAQMWEHGADLQWAELPGYDPSERRKIALPTYPFERELFWVEATQTLNASQAGAQRPGGAEAGKKRIDLGSWSYVPVWQSTPAASMALPQRSEALAGWVILDDGSALAAKLAEKLAETGMPALRVSAPKSETGSRSALGDNAARDHFEKFWKEQRDVLSSGAIGLINCWTLRGAQVDFHPMLVLLLQTAQRARVRFAQMEMIFDQSVSVNAEPIEDCDRAVIEGVARTIGSEFAGTVARIIDPGHIAADREAELTPAADWIVAETRTVPSGGLAVARRGNLRWQRVWTPLRLAANATSRFRFGGTYVITGGVGGIGYVMARHLKEKYQARVALIGRTVLPPRERWEEWLTEHGQANSVSQRIQRVKELESLGGELLMLSADVADQSAMERVWAEVESRFGHVHGVIHAAGLPDGTRIGAQERSATEAVLRPKVQGSKVLAQLLAGKPVDFLVFCSSISAIVPIAGASAYAAANAFQDSYALWCRQHLGLPVQTINFDSWAEVGMAVEAAESVESAGLGPAKAALAQRAILPVEGIELFERILASEQPQVLVSTIDFSEVLSQHQEMHLKATATPNAGGGVNESADGSRSRSTAGDNFTVAPETETVISIWHELLGADRIEPNDNFFELGGHSLLGTMVLARVREYFGVELSIRAIFESPTPESLSIRIREAGPRQLEPVGRGDSQISHSVQVAEDREEFEI